MATAPPRSGFPARVRAVLGPTNTGKTHLAIERLLAHASGIIGFPLRLLARENYDRMAARVGAARVALITGEEKIVPPGARWFACTVEAMPLDCAVEFLAVDEIQLCADPDRGHVFTHRLLHARGLVETMFLGADTIGPILRRLVPDAEVETRPRLSQLRHAGPCKLSRLPPRSAVVAFSANEVYAIAEAIRRRRGGCAVVMGRLSPRARNAQVALYQDKEVDFLVATDAIGMGLNMDVDHVAFAGLSKFDGHRLRALRAPELAQVAGRAGRGMRDGTFGTTAECPPLDPELARAVEEHEFEQLDHLTWRGDPDFSGLPALVASLDQPPPRRDLVRGPDADDVTTLHALAHDREIAALAAGRRRLRLLWECCQIPDFRKLADDSHARFCATVFGHLARGQVLPEPWVATRIDALMRTEGDIDTLMQRLAGVRVWAYLAARADWLHDAPRWQARAAEVEDALSDALHEKLSARFVDRRAAVLLRRLDDDETLLSGVAADGAVTVEGHHVGRIAGLGFQPDEHGAGAGSLESRRLMLRAARRVLHTEVPRRAALLGSAADEAFTLRADHMLCWDGAPVGRLLPGGALLRPAVAALDNEHLDGPDRERVRRRLAAFVAALIAHELGPLFAAELAAANDPVLRGPLHRLREGAGVAPGATDDVAPPARAALKRLGVRAGRLALFVPALLKPRPTLLRARLWALHRDVAVPKLPGPERVSLPALPTDWPAGFAEAMGWMRLGPAWLRLDVAERAAAELAHLARTGAAPAPAGLAGRLGVAESALPAVLRGLGFRLRPAPVLPPGWLGPPAPPTVRAMRQANQPAAGPEPRSASPFAVLRGMRGAMAGR